jgi:hypothetical protein
MADNFKENNGILLQGHIKIHDPISGEVLINKRNAIHYENMSISLAESLANAGEGWIYEMSFGNGGTSIDPTGIITYLTPNSTGANASLYNQTFTKVVDDRSVNNIDPVRNKIETRHVSGTNYTDILVTCLLDYGEPNGQGTFTFPDGAKYVGEFRHGKPNGQGVFTLANGNPPQEGIFESGKFVSAQPISDHIVGRISSTTPVMNSITIASAKCLELGFKRGTEKFGECVLKISK